MKVHRKEELSEADIELRKHRREANIEYAFDFFKEWGENIGLAVLVVLGISLLLSMIGVPIYLVCSGIAKHIIWRIVVGIIWIFVDIGFFITLDN